MQVVYCIIAALLTLLGVLVFFPSLISPHGATWIALLLGFALLRAEFSQKHW